MITPEEIARLRAACVEVKPIGVAATPYDPCFGDVHVSRQALLALLDALEAGKPTRAQMMAIFDIHVMGNALLDDNGGMRSLFGARNVLLDALAAAGYLREARTEEGR